jgi:SRSO17 transposase
MGLVLDLEGQHRLAAYFSGLGQVLGSDSRRASFAVYAMGLLGDGERKSMEPVAARACPDPDRADAEHQRLHHFCTHSAWSDREIRREAARYGIGALAEREPIDAWLVDDTGFLKQGSHSVGVQRQYTGSAGKITNCQLGVSLGVATRTEHLPIDFELYLPTSWTDDPARRAEGCIPDHVQFKTKVQLALEMVDRAIADDVPRGVMLADADYGRSVEFRDGVRERGLDYALAVPSTTVVWRIDAQDCRRGDSIAVAALAAQIARRRGFRRVTWRDATKKPLTARFAVRRVLPVADDGWDPARERERVWLICEWPDDEKEPTKFYFATLPEDWSKKRLIRLIKERWRTERIYEDLKGELGLDHFEGRRYRGWHHHVSVALCCYAFVVAERVRRFPPTARRSQGDDALGLAA